MTKEALKLALEALESERDKYLEWGDEDGAPEDVYEAITAIKQALAMPAAVQPVAWMYQCTADNSGPVLLRYRTNWAESGTGLWIETPLYTTAAQRKPLTDEQIEPFEDDEE